MKTACLVGKRQIEIRDFEKPSVPDDGLIIAIEACGICGSDIRRWHEGPPTGCEFLVQGHEAAGSVIETGKYVSNFRAGDKIAIAPDIHCGDCEYCHKGLFNLCDNLKLIGITPGVYGCFSDYLVITNEIIKNGIIHHIPEGISPVSATLAETMASVLACQERYNVASDEVVVIMGAGPVGCLHATIAKLKNARVVLIEPSDNRRTIALKTKPDLVLNPLEVDPVQSVLKFTNGHGADVIICANPVWETQAQAVQMAKKRGRIIFFGGLPKDNPITKLDANKIHYRELTVGGAFSYHPDFHKMALEILATGKVRADDFITNIFPLSQIDKGFEAAASGKELKVVIVPDAVFPVQNKK